MRILIAGSSGFLGTHLRAALLARGHTVIRLVRGRADGSDEMGWSPYDEELDPAVLSGVDAVVNLAGSPTLGNPHSKKWARDLEHSRVTTTAVLARAIARAEVKPAFIAGNGISIYGDHGDEVLDEQSDSRGDALLTRVTRAWQTAAEPAAEAGARLVVLRTSPVLDRRAAPLKQQLLQFRLGLGGKLGSGNQWFPCLGLADTVNAIVFCAEGDLSGPVNLTLPEPATNADFTNALAAALHRPALVSAPGFVLRRVAGAMAPELLGSIRVVPKALLDAGFEFAHPDIDETIDAGLNR